MVAVTVILDSPEKVEYFAKWFAKWEGEVKFLTPNLAGGTRDLEIYELEGTLEAFADLPPDFFDKPLSDS
ncbi:MAG: hypothetical protein ACRCYY_09575 [Trueperaceae bacterium]